MVQKQDLPSFFILLLCDTLLCKVQMAIDDSISKSSENDLNKYVSRYKQLKILLYLLLMEASNYLVYSAADLWIV